MFETLFFRFLDIDLRVTMNDATFGFVATR